MVLSTLTEKDLLYAQDRRSNSDCRNLTVQGICLSPICIGLKNGNHAISPPARFNSFMRSYIIERKQPQAASTQIVSEQPLTLLLGLGL